MHQGSLVSGPRPPHLILNAIVAGGMLHRRDLLLQVLYVVRLIQDVLTVIPAVHIVSVNVCGDLLLPVQNVARLIQDVIAVMQPRSTDPVVCTAVQTRSRSFPPSPPRLSTAPVPNRRFRSIPPLCPASTLTHLSMCVTTSIIQAVR